MSEEKPKKKAFYKKWWFWLIIIILLYTIGSSGSDSAKTNLQSNKQQEPTNQQIQEQPTIKVRAVTLSQEYDDNQVAADAKYGGRMIEVSGVIDDIGKDILDNPYVVLHGRANSFFGIQCMFSKDSESQLATLLKEQSIILNGKVSGESIGNVIVKDCSIVN